MKPILKNISVLIVILIIISSSLIVSLNFHDDVEETKESLVPSNIWSYKTSKNQPTDAMVLSLELEQWQATAAACVTPAFIGRIQRTPIIFDDGFESKNIEIPHDTSAVTNFGTDVASAAGNIATTYWSKAEIVLITDNYEHVLWCAPLASFLIAPILINPNENTLKNLGTKCAIMIGGISSEPDVETTINLKTKEDVWSFQIDLYKTKGLECNYIVITNPDDTSDSLNQNIIWPYLSLATAPLAAFRNAVVQTGDYTANKTKMDKIANGMKRDDETYGQLKPYFEKVKSDSYHVEKFLVDRGCEPEFLALVGGSYAVPDYIFDIHVSYFYWSAKSDYIFSPAPYGDIEDKLDYIDYPQQELEIGRIIGHSILDATLQLTRTFFYNSFLLNGKYGASVSNGWEKKASVVERTKEIGMMKAIGAEDSKVAMLFLTEALIIGVIGGIIGYIVGSVLAGYIGQSVFDSAITPNLLVLPIIIGIAVGFTIISSIIPVRRAVKIEPAEVIRTV